MNMARVRQRGSAIIEMTLVGIPIIFMVISVFEMARGMWVYGTLSYAARASTRYVVVHGLDCQTAPNTCGITQQNLGNFINTTAAGLDPATLTVTFTSGNTGAFVDNMTCTLSKLMTNTCLGASSTAYIPSTGGNSVGTAVTITLIYPFSSAIGMFWPGAGQPFLFGKVNLPAISTDLIQF